MFLTLILFVILLATVAMLLREGIWSNMITLITVILAALLATILFEPIADMIEGPPAERSEGSAPTYTYLLDFICIWGVFVVAYSVMRALTDLLSKTQVRFKTPFNLGIGAFLAAWIGWVLVCFTAATLHTAPLPPSLGLGFYDEGLQDNIFLGFLAPDRQWLGFVHKVTGGSLSTSNSPERYVAQRQMKRDEENVTFWSVDLTTLGGPYWFPFKSESEAVAAAERWLDKHDALDANRFDPAGAFVRKYYERRERYQETPEFRVNRE